jgi:hypothetical protein
VKKMARTVWEMIKHTQTALENQPELCVKNPKPCAEVISANVFACKAG